MKILITLKDIYGKETVYPACEKAELFCQLAGTKTLTAAMLRSIQALGFEIVCKERAWS